VDEGITRVGDDLNLRPDGSSDGIEPADRVLPAYLPATRAEFLAERVDGADEDVHFTEAVVATVIESLTRPDDLVLDPFAGFGTALAVAGRLDRRAIGIELLRPGGHLVLNVANLRHAGHTTTLAWDVARSVGRVLPFVEESVICWDELPHDFTGDYLLTFRHEG
jgi:hypothetical protein